MRIKLKEYERIFQVISAILRSEDGTLAKSCIYYSIFAADILVQHFKLDANVKCGLAAFHLGGDNQALCFGERGPNGLLSTEDGFHCWVEVNGWALDFMAPTFGDIMATEFTSRPRMFQKQLTAMAVHPSEMLVAGEFFLSHNPELSTKVLGPVCDRLVVQDLTKMCTRWFTKPPKSISTEFSTHDQHGKIRPVTLGTTSIRSNW